MRNLYLPCALFIGLAFVSGSLLADYEDGVNAAFEGDFETALQEFTVAAEGGLDLAQYNLAILYFTGRGVDQDLAKAFQWTEAAAAQGHTNAQYNLGSLYIAGQGTARDIDTGVSWFSRAGRAGHADAAFALASLYLEGDDLDKDVVNAHVWASQAVYNEHPEAQTLKDEIEKQLDSEQLSQARRMFARWQIE